VNTKGEETKRVYHMPTDRYNHFHRVLAEEDDRWFCPGELAQNAGFLRSFK